MAASPAEEQWSDAATHDAETTGTSFDGGLFPSPSVFDTPTPTLELRISSQADERSGGQSDNDVMASTSLSAATPSTPEAHSTKCPGEPPHQIDEQLPSPSASADEVEEQAQVDFEEEKAPKLPQIERWEDLRCIRFLNWFHKIGGVNDRGHQILYRMCQLIWAVGHEVDIRKEVKLPRTQRLARFKRFCDCLLEGAKLWQKNMRAQIYRVWDLICRLPLLDDEAFQDLEPKLHEWYSVLYGLHREKPDYGLRDVLPTADKVYKLLMKLPKYALEADELILEFELHFWEAVDRYYKDRTRQLEEVAEFDAMPPEEKQAGFRAYMRHWQPNFIRKLNNADSGPMSQKLFDEQLKEFRMDFLNRVADIVKHDEFQVEEYDLDYVDHGWIRQRFHEQQDRKETRKGWAEALSLSLEALDTDDDDEDRKSVQTVSEAFWAALEGEPIPENSTVASLLRGGDYSGWQLQGIVDWDRFGGIRFGNEILSQRRGSSGQEWPPTPHAAPSQVKERDQEDLSGASQLKEHTTQSLQPSEEQSLPHVVPSPGETAPYLRQVEHDEAGSRLPLHISKSFAAVEDDLAARGHQRSSTVPDTNYTTTDSDESNPPRPAASFHGRATNTRRHGVHVPRIFTGSFSQLETDIRRLQLDKVNTPEDQPDLSQAYDPEHDLKIRDFAITLQISPSPTPSPATLLFRREALLSKETELQNRVINGQVVRIRRPSTKTRAQTIDETTGGLAAWLAKQQDNAGSPAPAVPPLPRLERKNTI